MYEAIGYSESAQVPVYPKEVSQHEELRDYIHTHWFILQYVAHSISVRLEKVSVQLRNENGT